MGFSVSGLSAYIDQTGELIQAKVTNTPSLDGNVITIRPGVKDVASINLVNATPVAVSGSCGSLTDAGAVTFTQKLITVCPITFPVELCVSELNDKYTSLSVSKGSDNETTIYETMIEDLFGRKVRAELEKYVWQGYGTCVDGLIAQMSSSINTGGGVILPPTATGSLTDATIGPIINAMVDAIPTELQGQPIDIYMEWNSAKLYQRYLNKQFGNGIVNPKDGMLWVEGAPEINFHVIPGLAGTDVIVLAPKDMLFRGVDEVFDETTLGFEKVNGKVSSYWLYLTTKLGTQIGFDGQIVVNDAVIV